MIKRILISILLALILAPTQTIAFASNSKPWDGGYIDNWGNNIPGYITNDTWMTPMPKYVKGKAVFYGPLSMDATAEYREIDYEEEGCIGGVSLMSPIDIGKKVWVRVDGNWYGPFCSVDCAKKGEMYSIVVIREEVVEFSFDMAVELGMVSPLFNDYTYKVYDWYKNVEVYIGDENPNEYLFKLKKVFTNFEPINYKDYFLNTLEFATGWEPRVILTQDNIWKEFGRDVYWYQ